MVFGDRPPAPLESVAGMPGSEVLLESVAGMPGSEVLSVARLSA